MLTVIAIAAKLCVKGWLVYFYIICMCVSQSFNFFCLSFSLYLICPKSLFFSIFLYLYLSVSTSFRLYACLSFSISLLLCLSVSLSLCLSVPPALRLFASPSLGLSVWLFLHLGVSQFIYLSVSLSLCFVYLSVCLFLCIYIFLSLHLSPSSSHLSDLIFKFCLSHNSFFPLKVSLSWIWNKQRMFQKRPVCHGQMQVLPRLYRQ